MMAVGEFDSSTGERREEDVGVKDGIPREASASSVMRNSADRRTVNAGTRNRRLDNGTAYQYYHLEARVRWTRV
jgi:hypothetical protein